MKKVLMIIFSVLLVFVCFLLNKNSVNNDSFDTTDIVLTESITISKAGVYYLSGKIDDGLITINTKGNVKLILNNVSISNSSGPAIYVKNANKVVISINGVNNLSDGNNYDSDKGVIFSKSDLLLEGSGSLVIDGKSDAIVGKGNLEINGGEYEITSGADGIKAKDSITVSDGKFIINALEDGIQADNKLLIENGTFNIVTNSSKETTSMKGIKANDITINNGNFTFNTYDDAIHSNNSILINNGTYLISTSDDGIHADNYLTIENGNIEITKSYEGLEANNIVINDGEIKIVATDDGINGANSDNVSKITINGGTIFVDALGDGIDCNDSIYVNGGTIYVNGPEDDRNGALDYDNDFVMTNGFLLALGSSGMALNIGPSSSQYGLLIYLSSTYKSGTNISIKSGDDEILAFTSIKSFSSIVFSSDKIKKDNIYSLYINDSLYYTFSVNQITTTIGNRNNRNFRR